MSQTLKTIARSAGLHDISTVAGDPSEGNTINLQAMPSIDSVIQQLATVLIGKEHQIRLALACMIARGHLLIEDVPGVGKTTLAHALGTTLGLPWTRIQFTSDLLPGDVVGVSVFNATTHTFEFNPGPVFTSVLLADEINRAPPKAQSALLEAMEERQVSVDGQTHPLPAGFFVIATQNAADQLGAYPLPESQLDRFLAGIEIGYPDEQSERTLLSGGDRRANIEKLSPLINHSILDHWSDAAAKLTVSDTLLDYVQALLAATRAGSNANGSAPVSTDKHVLTSHGLSPRAGLSLLAMARAWAWLHGADHVLPEDIQAIFPAVAGHRLTGSVRAGAVHCADLLDRVAVS